MYIKVRAFPKSKNEIVKKISEDTYEIHIKEKAERNMANKRIIEIIASELYVDEGKVRIINGHHNTSKMLSIKN